MRGMPLNCYSSAARLPIGPNDRVSASWFGELGDRHAELPTAICQWKIMIEKPITWLLSF